MRPRRFLIELVCTPEGPVGGFRAITTDYKLGAVKLDEHVDITEAKVLSQVAKAIKKHLKKEK
jgi:hypothetical protein